MIDRRTFIGAIAAFVATAPLAATAQPARSHRIGFLGNGSPATLSSQDEAFRRSLRELGWIEDQNVTIEYRWAEGNPDRLPSPYFDAQHARLIEVATRYRLPACYEFRNYVRDGGLMSYGPSIDAMFARSASYVDRILMGANPGDLAIEQPTKLELVINLNTAKALALTIPQSLLLRADEVIQ